MTSMPVMRGYTNKLLFPFLWSCSFSPGCFGLFSGVTRLLLSSLPVDSAIGFGPGLIPIKISLSDKQIHIYELWQ